ncbi:glycerophosphodiester phosphodiesterase [Halomarina oriensis]|uniref:Glycerophosphodiester phosphodiesterase n=1 Tax=Halomarina oriensis TaxID=671145 RepID=A0A6B0GSW0_9EURY|nr:glycerophosphodiester phosphodiesterase family protein [Halomarina oriensis]MWG35743.1 glycerophosphodiester phosphodiesterase [Halomarina oriensis]
MQVIGHRGCADRAPENTRLAVRRAASHVDMVEIDVRRCGSGELVVVHDDRLRRLTGARGRVSETPYSRLRSLRVLGSEQSIPLLADLLADVPDGVGVNVELKHAGMAADLLAVLDGVDNEVLVSSFERAALREVGEHADLPLAFLFHQELKRLGRDWRHGLARARHLDCAAVHPSVGLCEDAPEHVAAARDEGFTVNVWTVKRSATARRLHEMGVDGLIVDDWAVV